MRETMPKCIGLLKLNESQQQDMLEILQVINKRYVQYKQVSSDGNLHEPLPRFLFDGDQLNGKDLHSCRRFPLHDKLRLLIVTKFYDTKSIKDVRTSKQT